MKRIRSHFLAVVSMLLIVGCGGAIQDAASEGTSTGTSPINSQSLTNAQPRAPEEFMSCYDECYQAGNACPAQCGVSYEECAAATSSCYDSCSRGVGPWLPC